jgi:hypothetical protein
VTRFLPNPEFASNPVVAVQPTVGWFAVLTREDSDPYRPLTAVPIEHATVHEDGQRVLWVEDLKGFTAPLWPRDYRAVVRTAPDVDAVEWSPAVLAHVPEESTASWRWTPSA